MRKRAKKEHQEAPASENGLTLMGPPPTSTPHDKQPDNALASPAPPTTALRSDLQPALDSRDGEAGALRSCSGGSDSRAAANSGNEERRPSSQSQLASVRRCGASSSSGDTTENTRPEVPPKAKLLKKIRIIQPISTTWCREALASQAQGAEPEGSTDLHEGGNANAGLLGSCQAKHGSKRKGACSDDACDSGAGGGSLLGQETSAPPQHRQPPDESGDVHTRCHTAAAAAAAAADAGLGSAQRTVQAVAQQGEQRQLCTLAPAVPQPQPSVIAATAGVLSAVGTGAGVLDHNQAQDLTGQGQPTHGGVMILGEVQGQLALLYHWYVTNRNSFLDQTKSFVSGLDLLVHQHRGTSPRHHEVDAVNQAVQTALQIIKTSTDLECAWQAATTPDS